jgi:hypothetical protein
MVSPRNSKTAIYMNSMYSGKFKPGLMLQFPSQRMGRVVGNGETETGQMAVIRYSGIQGDVGE